MLRQTSLGTLGLGIGGVLTVIGFVAYFSNNATLNLVGFFYGIPLVLGGLALKASELKPVPIAELPSDEILALREQQATEIQNQLRKDVTRYRYGQSAHLDSSLERLGLSPTDEERPVLQGLRETAIAGRYALILEFESPLISLEVWQQKQEKIQTFFGPGLQAEVAQPSDNRIELTLVAVPKSE